MPRQRTGGVNYDKKRRAWVARLDWTDVTGGRRCRKKQVLNKTEGGKLLKKWLKELGEHGETIIDGERMKFRRLAEVYGGRKLVEPVYKGETKVAGLRSHQTQKTYLKTLVAYFGHQRIQYITHSDIEQFKLLRLSTPVVRTVRNADGDLERVERPRSVAHVNRELALLRTMLNFAKRSGWITRNPFELGDPLISTADEAKRERILTREEEARLLAACGEQRKHLRPILICALDTALRQGEIFQLKWSDVDLDAGVIRVRATTTKTMKSRTVGVSARLRAELEALWEASPKDPARLVFGIEDNVKRSFEGARKDAGLDDFRFHDLRHTAITRMIQRGIGPLEVMKISGHTQMTTFLRYVNTNEQTAVRAAAAVDDWHAAGEGATSGLVN
jgi:integrase